jgi:carbon storage regulator
VLILTRRLGETLVIGPSIRVTVVGLRGNQVRIGIEAPSHVRVHRQELYERIQRGEARPRQKRTGPVTTLEQVWNISMVTAGKPRD